jgi:hypothetical protein
MWLVRQRPGPHKIHNETSDWLQLDFIWLDYCTAPSPQTINNDSNRISLAHISLACPGTSPRQIHTDPIPREDAKPLGANMNSRVIFVFNPQVKSTHCSVSARRWCPSCMGPRTALSTPPLCTPFPEHFFYWVAVLQLLPSSFSCEFQSWILSFRNKEYYYNWWMNIFHEAFSGIKFSITFLG